MAYPTVDVIVVSHDQVIAEAIKAPIEVEATTFEAILGNLEGWIGNLAKCCLHSPSRSVNRDKDYCYSCYQLAILQLITLNKQSQERSIFWTINILLF